MKPIKRRISEKVSNALKSLDIIELPESAKIEIPPQPEFGDYATNAALVCAKLAKANPRELAEKIKQILAQDKMFEKVEVAAAGYVNLFLSFEFLLTGIKEALCEDKNFGDVDFGNNKKVLVEFVSANPTGPLHIGHGRNAALGDSLARLLRAAGFLADREYYINDAGKQIATLGLSVFARYQEILGKSYPFPEDGYKGEYIKDIAKRLLNEKGKNLTEKDIEDVTQFAVDDIMNGIKKDLEDFGVEFEFWTSEKALIASGEVERTLKFLEEKKESYFKDGALWFKSSNKGDEKDRVIIKSDGSRTYLATDIAYHKQKLERGYQMLVNILGADHHGYVPRLKAAIEALGYDKECLKPLLIQMVNLLRAGERVSMSTRAGEFVTLREIIDEVGKDAARFFYMQRRHDAQLDFDLELAKKQSQENPVYYVQYMHARIASVFRVAQERGIKIPDDLSEVDLSPLSLPEERAIMLQVLRLPETIEEAARDLEPHRLTSYLTELASRFHHYYNHHRIIGSEYKVMMARMALSKATQLATKKALSILGVSAPDRM